MSTLVALLIVVPLLVSVVLLVVADSRARNALVVGACTIVAGLSVVTAGIWLAEGAPLFFGPPLDVDPVGPILAAELLVAAIVVVISVQHRRRLANDKIAQGARRGRHEIPHAVHVDDGAAVIDRFDHPFELRDQSAASTRLAVAR